MTWIRRHALLLVLCVTVTIPLWIVRYPPMQDFPNHAATIRVLHDLGAPGSGLAEDYELTLGRTQYLGFYACGHVLAYVFGARSALILVALYLVGTIVAVRQLLLVLGRDERLALVVLPLLYGPLLTLGLLPFLVAIPVLVLGVAALVARLRGPSPLRHFVVAVIGFALFYLHVQELGIFLLAGGILFPFKAPNRARVASFASLLPGGVALAWWFTSTNVGRRVLDVGKGWGSGNRPPLLAAIADIVPWLTDSFTDVTDEITLALALAALAGGAILAHQETSAPTTSLRRYALLPLLCLLLYLTGERSRGSIWPLAPRYVLITALLAIPLLVMPKRERARKQITIALALSGLACIVNVAVHWVMFDRTDVGDFDGALAQIAPKQRVVTLVYGARSSRMRFYSFLHYGAYYQAEKAGVAYHTFAGYDYWPFDFKQGRYPIYDGPATPSWEMYPALANEQPLSSYFDYALVRDRGENPAPHGFHIVWSGAHWEVFKADRNDPQSL